MPIQSPTIPKQSPTKTFAAVIAKQEQLSPQPRLRGRPDHQVPREPQQQKPQEPIENEKRKNPQAPHFWETKTNITNEIEAWN